MIRPTFRNLDESFEGWAYRSGLLRQVARLERQGFLERRSKENRIYRLTTAGRLRAIGGRDPKVQWRRPWDGYWRLICFDVPIADDLQRRRLRHYLRTRWFGLLQGSVWITPDEVQEQNELLQSTKVDVKSLVIFQARACAGESDRDIVVAGWDFDRINLAYRRHLRMLDERPLHKVISPSGARALLNWAEAEHAAWTNTIAVDPLLPQVLLPRSYLGRQVWRRRVQALAAAYESIHAFKP